MTLDTTELYPEPLGGLSPRERQLWAHGVIAGASRYRLTLHRRQWTYRAALNRIGVAIYGFLASPRTLRGYAYDPTYRVIDRTRDR